MHVRARQAPTPLQAKDIPELPILAFLYGLAPAWATWCAGYKNSVPRSADVPDKVLRAKMAALIRRGLVDGCPCGCRGDYRLTQKGREWLQVRVDPHVSR